MQTQTSHKCLAPQDAGCGKRVWVPVTMELLSQVVTLLYDWPNHQEAKDAPLDHTRFLWLYIFPRTSLFASEFLQPRLFWWLLGPKAYLTHTCCLMHFTRVKKPAHSNLAYSFIPTGLPLKSSFTFPVKTGVQVLMETGEKNSTGCSASLSLFPAFKMVFQHTIMLQY